MNKTTRYIMIELLNQWKGRYLKSSNRKKIRAPGQLFNFSACEILSFSCKMPLPSPLTKMISRWNDSGQKLGLACFFFSGHGLPAVLQVRSCSLGKREMLHRNARGQKRRPDIQTPLAFRGYCIEVSRPWRWTCRCTFSWNIGNCPLT